MSFGNQYGPLWLYGLIVVAVPGTAVPLSQNVPTKEAGLGTVEMNANQLILKAPLTNQSTAYLVYRGGSKNLPNSIIVDLVPGQSITLGSSAANSPYRPADLFVDADVALDGIRVTAIIGT